MNPVNNQWKFSRSHQNAYKECPQLCWLKYYEDGTGYESARVNVEQSTGTLLHSALQGIMEHVRATDSLPPESVVAASLQSSIEAYKQEVLERGFDVEQVGDMKMELMRQSALVEGLVRAWVAVRLPEILERYKVVSVEEEWEVELDPEVVCMMRIDTILEERDSKDLWPLEFKTSGWMSDGYLEKYRYDSQTLMHGWATENHYGRVCGGVRIEVFYKGYTNRDKETGAKVYHSPLVKGYMKRGAPPFDDDEFSWDYNVGRRKGWESIRVWEQMDMKAWVGLLPENVLREQLFGIDIYRNESEVETWIAQTIIEQKRIRDAVPKAGDPQVMMEVFPSRLDEGCYSNKYRKKCPFLQVCWEGILPSESEQYRVRRPHHSTEKFEVEED